MEQEKIQEVFDFMGLSKLGEGLSFKLWLKDAMKEDDLEVLEMFLSSYDFAGIEGIVLDEFLYHFYIYRNFYNAFG